MVQIVQRVIAALILTTTLIVIESRPVYACSGFPPSFDSSLAAATYVVRAHVIRSDAALQSDVIEIESYISGGSGPKYLLVTRNTPVVVQGLIDGHLGGGDCYGFQESLPSSGSFYLFLSRTFWGSYVSTLGGYFGPEYYSFGAEASQIAIQTAENIKADEYTELTESAFIDFIREQTGLEPAKPQDDLFYPPTAPLLLTTALGTNYLLPVDGQPPTVIDNALFSEMMRYFLLYPDTIPGGCLSIDCVIFAADGTTAAIRLDEGMWITNGWGMHVIPGTEILFSPGAAAVWNDDSLDIYSLHSAISYASEDYPQLEGNVLLQGGKLARGSKYSAWSADGRMLAYSDQNGLWLWHVFTDMPPRLLVPSIENQIPYARYFSSGGSYLAITESDSQSFIEILTGKRLPDGAISPNERLLIGIVEDSPNPAQIQISQLIPPDSINSFDTPLDDTQAKRIEWVDENYFVALICELGVSENCFVYHVNFPGSSDWYGSNFVNYSISFIEQNSEPGKAFAVQNGNVVVLVDNDSISINRHQMDLELDSDIVTVKWLPTLLYGG